MDADLDSVVAALAELDICALAALIDATCKVAQIAPGYSRGLRMPVIGR
jgi:hypothetical protein